MKRISISEIPRFAGAVWLGALPPAAAISAQVTFIVSGKGIEPAQYQVWEKPESRHPCQTK
jgi:hypothetical protein